MSSADNFILLIKGRKILMKTKMLTIHEIKKLHEITAESRRVF